MIAADDVGSAWKAVPWARVFSGEIIADRLFLRSALIRKDVLPLFAGKDMPLTFACKSGADAEKANEGFRDGSDGTALNKVGRRWGRDNVEIGAAWVVKPSDSSNAFGVRFCAEAALAACVSGAVAEDAARVSPWIAQRAVASLLLDGRKFHLRALLLVVGDLDAFVFDDARVLVAPCAPTNDYDEHAHVTNRSLNMRHAQYDVERHNMSLKECAALDGGGDEPRWPRGGALRQMRDISAALSAQLVKHSESLKEARGTANDGDADAPPRPPQEAKPKSKRVFFPLPNTWELFGLDFMVDTDREIVLLEANPEPSMDMWGLTKVAILRGLCPISQGVPRSNEVSTGFTKVFSKRFEAALQQMRAQRAAAAKKTAQRAAAAKKTDS
ncbi:hypothetical protein M885DRAFT_611412 [Pelagophyceae sp. CCMP2097]|nr:hypothetical protein M885DRAFT_611412 [Pelagophyceae sp. CCMP2097]